jgi:hypothetical protein
MPCSDRDRWLPLLSLLLLAPAHPCAAIDSFLSDNPQAPSAVPYCRSVEQLHHRTRHPHLTPNRHTTPSPAAPPEPTTAAHPKDTGDPR